MFNKEGSFSAHQECQKGQLQPEPQEEEIPGEEARGSEGSLQINSETVVKEEEWSSGHPTPAQGHLPDYASSHRSLVTKLLGAD